METGQILASGMTAAGLDHGIVPKERPSACGIK